LQSISEGKNEKEEEVELIAQIKKHSPIYPFMFALRSSEARRQYPKLPFYTALYPSIY
jgi:hypothetical protein